MAIDACGPSGLAAHAAAWQDLMAAALEPNVHMHPAFALPAATLLPNEHHVTYILAYRPLADGTRQLCGLLGLQAPRRFRPGIGYSWDHDNASLAGPLLHKDHGAAALTALLAWLTRHRKDLQALCLQGVVVDGPTHHLVRHVAAQTGRACRDGRRVARAVLRPGADHATQRRQSMSANRRNRLRRQERDLAALGEVTYTSTRDPAALPAAAEEFFALEQAGWKGASGTALLSKADTARFARALLISKEGAASGLWRVEALRVNGKAVAMAMVMAWAGTLYVWKIAYDETVAKQSPGVQLIFKFMATLLADPTWQLADSCAQPNHPMIDVLWPERLTTGEVFLETRRTRWHLGFQVAVGFLLLLRQLQSQLQSLAQGWVARTQQKRPAGGVPTGQADTSKPVD